MNTQNHNPNEYSTPLRKRRPPNDSNINNHIKSSSSGSSPLKKRAHPAADAALGYTPLKNYPMEEEDCDASSIHRWFQSGGVGGAVSVGDGLLDGFGSFDMGSPLKSPFFSKDRSLSAQDVGGASSSSSSSSNSNKENYDIPNITFHKLEKQDPKDQVEDDEEEKNRCDAVAKEEVEMESKSKSDSDSDSNPLLHTPIQSKLKSKQQHFSHCNNQSHNKILSTNTSTGNGNSKTSKFLFGSLNADFTSINQKLSGRHNISKNSDKKNNQAKSTGHKLQEQQKQRMRMRSTFSPFAFPYANTTATSTFPQPLLAVTPFKVSMPSVSDSSSSSKNPRKRKNFKSNSTPEDSGCHCSKSQCLKLYCVCFAKLVLCDPLKCKCVDCLNIEGSEEREKAVLLRKKKAGSDDLVKKKGGGGCRCKKSNCLKRYCECFQAGKPCDPSLCRCVDCKNTAVDGKFSSGSGSSSTGLALNVAHANNNSQTNHANKGNATKLTSVPIRPAVTAVNATSAPVLSSSKKKHGSGNGSGTSLLYSQQQKQQTAAAMQMQHWMQQMVAMHPYAAAMNHPYMFPPTAAPAKATPKSQDLKGVIAVSKRRSITSKSSSRNKKRSLPMKVKSSFTMVWAKSSRAFFSYFMDKSRDQAQNDNEDTLLFTNASSKNEQQEDVCMFNSILYFCDNEDLSNAALVNKKWHNAVSNLSMPSSSSS